MNASLSEELARYLSRNTPGWEDGYDWPISEARVITQLLRDARVSAAVLAALDLDAEGRE